MTKTNKSVKALVGLFIFSFLFASKAIADDKRFYAGIDASSQKLALDIYSTTSDGTNFSPSAEDYYETNSFVPYLFAGFDNGSNLKIEASYSRSSEEKGNPSTGVVSYYGSSLSSKSEIKTQTIGLDFKPYAKINDKFLAYGILGVSQNKLDIKESIYCDGTLCESYSESVSKLAPTLGFGAEYFLTSNVAVRTQFKYTYLNAKTPDSFGIKEIKSVTNLNIGVGYYF